MSFPLRKGTLLNNFILRIRKPKEPDTFSPVSFNVVIIPFMVLITGASAAVVLTYLELVHSVNKP